MMNTTRPNTVPVHPVQKSRRKVARSRGLRGRALTACCGLALLAGVPGSAYAQAPGDDTSDARLQGYAGRPALEKSGVGPTWLLFIALSIVGCSVLFKNAKRTHLD